MNKLISLKQHILFLGLFLLTSLAQAQTDAPDCKDHPMISRYPGSVLIWCSADNFSEYHVATGPITGYRNIDEWTAIEGKVYRHNYELYNETVTMNEVYQNYRNALTRSGFEILAAGSDPNRTRRNEVGGSTWIGVAYIKNPLPQTSRSRLFLGSSSSGGHGHVAAKLARPEGDIYVVVTVYKQSAERIITQIDITEVAPLEDDKITVDVDYLAREIAIKGAVSLYGIYFDFDRAEVTPESDPELQVIADYLGANPSVSLYVVGHTDYEGNLNYNLDLSDRRASSVVAKLAADYGINKDRLVAKGVGPLAPKTSNETEEERAKNRRVELVLWKR
ncbi:MAG: OmpA family protein [Bacteroidota bacterium]